LWVCDSLKKRPTPHEFHKSAIKNQKSKIGNTTMVDYRINLAKTVTSTPEQRRKFYNGMILYLSLCAAGLVYVAYLASSNVMEAYNASRQRRSMVKAVSSVSGFSKTFYRNPDKAYDELQLYAADLALLKTAFAQRTHFLPVLNQLFANFPEEVAVENLEASAANNSIAFGLVGSGKSVKAQQLAWKQNAELNGLVRSIKQIKGEQRMVGGQPVYFVKFKCMLK
jgi:recombinational DNA repair ATPase RecF